MNNELLILETLEVILQHAMASGSSTSEEDALRLKEAHVEILRALMYERTPI